jgi:hypothetical protein
VKDKKVISPLAGITLLLMGSFSLVHAGRPTERMVEVFDGDHTRYEITNKMSKALRLYGLPVTKKYYSKAGSALVSLANSHRPSEMEMLTCVIEAHEPDVNTDFADAAALCAVTLD